MAEAEEKSQDLPPAEPAEKMDALPEEEKEDIMEQEEESKQEDQAQNERAQECKHDDGDQDMLQEFYSFPHLAIMDQYDQTTCTIVLHAPVFAGQDHEVAIHIVVPADAAKHKDLKPGDTVAVIPPPDLGDPRESTPLRLPYSALRLLGSDEKLTPEEEL